MRASLLLVLSALAFLPVQTNAGQVVLANFDDLADGTRIEASYPGMLMSGWARPQSWARSAPNVAYSPSGGVLFPSGATWVSFYEQNTGTIAVYDLAGILMDFLAPVGAYPWTRVDLRYERPIGRLSIIAYGGTAYPYYLDDFSYEYIPEPASLAGLALGLAGLAGVVRRRRRQAGRRVS